MLTYERVKRRFPEVRVNHGKNGPEFNVNCPKPHKKGGLYKLDINVSTGAFICHDCGFSGNAYEEWFDEADELFAHLAIRRDEGGIDPAVLDRLKPVSSARRGGETMENGVPAPGKIVPMKDLPPDHIAWEYLVRDRGLDYEDLCRLEKSSMLYYCIKGHPTRGSGTNSGRIVFPVYVGEKLCGWQARQIERITAPDRGSLHPRKMVWQGDSWRDFDWVPEKGQFRDKLMGIPKYNTCAGMPRSECFYNFRTASRYADMVVIVEGPIDVLSVGSRAIATMGSLSGRQKQLITSTWDSAVILRDPDVDPASEKFKSILGGLSAIPVIHLALPDGKDPGSTPREVIWKCIAEERERAEAAKRASYRMPVKR